ncbi:MAG: AEC family transporter [Dongiaceae bacterium]
MYSELFAIIAPVLICAGIGFVWARRGRAFETEFVTNLVTMVGTPCLIASTLTSLDIPLDALGEVAIASLAATAGFALIGMAVLRAMKLPFHSFLPALMFPNTGNMGLPLCLFAFGEAGLAFAIVIFALTATLQFTVGIAIVSGSFSLKRFATMPILYAVAFSVVVIATGWTVPQWIGNTIELLGGVTIPMMLLALGVSLARLRVTTLHRALVLSLVRLAGGAAVGYGIGVLFDLSDLARGAILIQATMPVAVFNYLFAQYYSRQPEQVAGMVMLSTILSFLTLPLLLWAVL